MTPRAAGSPPAGASRPRRRTAGGRPGAAVLLVALLAALLIAPVPAGAEARPEDVPGWEAARWGMTGAELAEAFGDRLEPLPGRWDYGGAHADRAVFDVEIGGVAFTAFFQMNDRTGRLQQVLLQRRGRAAMARAYREVLDALEAEYGPPDARCETPRRGGAPLSIALTWSFPTTTIHAVFLDFYTSGMLFERPETWSDPLADHLRNRLINPDFLPRRVLVRYHDSARTDLLPPGACAGAG